MSAFPALVRLELRRAFSGRLFVVCLVLGVGLAIAAAAESIVSYVSYMQEGLPYLDASYRSQFAKSAFTQWLPMSVLRSVPNLFFFAAPLFIALAYSWSWRSDLVGGYAAGLLVRASRGEVYRAKALAVFAASAAVVGVPLLVNLAVVLCFVPAFTPNIVDVVYTGLWVRVFLSELLYTQPVLYVLVRLVLDVLLAGLWGAAVLGVSCLVRNRVAIVALPYIALIVVKSVSEAIYALLGHDWGALTILDHLKARGDQYYYGWGPVLLDAAVLLAVSVVIPALTRRRDVL